jgi:hypothetical protein
MSQNKGWEGNNKMGKRDKVKTTEEKEKGPECKKMEDTLGYN